VLESAGYSRLTMLALDTAWEEFTQKA
jgi:hypothetical protein